jgi:hypothetical protein
MEDRYEDIVPPFWDDYWDFVCCDGSEGIGNRRFDLEVKILLVAEVIDFIGFIVLILEEVILDALITSFLPWCSVDLKFNPREPFLATGYLYLSAGLLRETRWEDGEAFCIIRVLFFKLNLFSFG